MGLGMNVEIDPKGIVDVDPQRAAEILKKHWEIVTFGPKKDILKGQKRLLGAIRNSVNAEVMSYRYVLPTQLLAKLANSSLDCRGLQKSWGVPGAFDARSLCKKVIVKFDREHENVLGGSGEPYVSKPLRWPAVTREYREHQKRKEEWDALSFVLNKVEEKQESKFTERVFDQVLLEVYRRLLTTRVSYPLPQRVSLSQIENLVRQFLSEPSGGVRPEAILYSLLKTAGERFALFKRVEFSKVTTANFFAGRVADFECYDPSGNLRLAADSKDRELTVDEVQDKLSKMRGRNVHELLFAVYQDIKEDEKEEINKLIEEGFRTGQNIHIIAPFQFLRVLWPLIGEEGRAEFLSYVSEILDEYASYEHRSKWAELMAKLVQTNCSEE